MKQPTEAMLHAMLELQGRMNRKINPEWLCAGYEFLRAVLVEAVEALEHYGWKWWKRQDPNLEQLRIELIDIWHFPPAEIVLDGSTHRIAEADLRTRLDSPRLADELYGELERTYRSVVGGAARGAGGRSP